MMERSPPRAARRGRVTVARRPRCSSPRTSTARSAASASSSTAGTVYGPDVLVLGGDIAGKAIQAIDELGGGRFARRSAATRTTSTTPRSSPRRAADLRPRLLPLAVRAGRARGPRERRHRRRAARADAARASRRGWRWPTSGCDRGASPSSGCSATTIPRSWRRCSTGPWGDQAEGRVVELGDSARVLGLLEPDAVGQLPRDDRGGARRATSTRCSRRWTIRTRGVQLPRPAVRHRAGRGSRAR